MPLRGGTRNCPKLAEPFFIILLIYHAKAPLFLRGLPIAPGFSLHKNELDIILDDGIGLVWFTQELCPIVDFVIGVGNLVPDYGIQVVKSNSSANDADIGV